MVRDSAGLTPLPSPPLSSPLLSSPLLSSPTLPLLSYPLPLPNLINSPSSELPVLLQSNAPRARRTRSAQVRQILLEGEGQPGDQQQQGDEGEDEGVTSPEARRRLGGLLSAMWELQWPIPTAIPPDSRYATLLQISIGQEDVDEVGKAAVPFLLLPSQRLLPPPSLSILFCPLPYSSPSSSSSSTLLCLSLLSLLCLFSLPALVVLLVVFQPEEGKSRETKALELDLVPAAHAGDHP